MGRAGLSASAELLMMHGTY